ncbi:MAG: response regulator [bacterium]
MAETHKHILIVDDEEVIRDICARSLESRGYQVELAENGLKAQERLREKAIDVVFTDFRMPLMDGIELLGAIKRDYPHVEVVIMTAFATIESAIYAMKNGAYDFILKPVKPELIRVVAEKCFERIQLSEENKALRLANQKLVDLQNMKNKFIAVTSHELRTPVSHLKGFIGILTDDSIRSQLSAREEAQCKQVIMEAISDLEEMVMEMHNLIDLEDGKLMLRSESVDINLLSRNCVSAYNLSAKKRHHVLDLTACEQGLMVFVDRSQIKGVINELIQNAIKFTPDRGKINVTTRKEGDYAVISVKDNGIGIEESEQGKIFEKFYEIQDSNYHSSSKEKFLGGGLGLGLPMVRAIVEAHGGSVRVNSKKGSGSEFMVYLPLNGKQ